MNLRNWATRAADKQANLRGRLTLKWAACFAELIEADPIRLISAVSVLESGMLVEARKGEPGALEFDHFILRGQFQTIPFDAEQASIARLAFRRFGKGRHPAGLNFGDCAAYALASTRGEPLLFKGEDFIRTDIDPATGAQAG